MKAAMNGVLNVSVLDGWWDEGYEGDNGWAIGGREIDPDEAAQDWRDVAGPLPRSRSRSCRATTTATRPGCRPRWLDRDAPGDGDVDVALLDDADAPRVHRTPLSAGRRRPASASHRRRRRADRSRLTAAGLAPRIALALAIHNHQPVGNFDGVFAEAFEQATARCSRRSTGIRTSACRSTPAARCSMAARREARLHRPAARAASRATRSRSWAAASTSRSSPVPSATGSARLLHGRRLEKLFGRRPARHWLAERVWEPGLPTSLVAAGLRLDDPRRRALPGRRHPQDDLWGAYVTDDQGQPLTAGTEQGLRYRIPFRGVDEVIAPARHANEDGDRSG